ncbi:antigen 5 like allergen Cul n 1-like [Eurosta solidaginis]|uniref:antigen 5 like allergen Cul n 1-like n=1 Tax=Eurosta solidaginis TaxID=178769 RepID=UPI003530DF04
MCKLFSSVAITLLALIAAKITVIQNCVGTPKEKSILHAITTGAGNYCDKQLCNFGYKHVACGHNGRFAADCPSDAQLVDAKPYKDLFLKEVNSRRNQIAGSNLSGYESAKRMATMKWDKELSYLASLNVKQCKMAHDKCHTTTKYMTPGQNLYIYMASGSPGKNLGDIISKAISAWWSENKEGNMRLLKSINYNDPAYFKIGHFTVLATDDNNAMGCAVASYSKNNFKYTLIACNFAKMHMPGNSVYEVGKPASGCRKGRNPQHKNLCSVKEVYN